MLHYLRKICHRHMVGHIDMPGSRDLLSANELHDRGLAGAILPDQAYPVPFAYMETYVIQEVIAPERYGQIVYRYHLSFISFPWLDNQTAGLRSFLHISTLPS